MYSSSKGNKNIWVILIFMLCGLVIGGWIGEYLGDFEYFKWLDYAKTFGLSQPLILDLNIIVLSFGLTVNINISGVIGMIIGIFLFKKII